MSGTITALVVQKNNKERVNVYLDDEFAFGVTLSAALTLKKGQELTDAEITQLKADDTVDKAYDQSLRYLSFRPRTIQEVRQYLQKKGISDENTEFVIERLTNQGYLNDAEFGRVWVNDRERLNPKGKRALQYELRQKGLSEKDIQQALDDLDEEALAWQAVEKQIRRWQNLDETAFRQKLAGYLARRGFDYDIIQLIFDKAWAEQRRD